MRIGAARIQALDPATTRACAITRVDHDDEIIATMIGGNPLAAGWPEADLVDGATGDETIITWSGTLADELFASHPLTWMTPGRETLDRFCARVAPGLAAAGRTLCLHPHARHVLSDPPSCLAFLRDHEDVPITVALAPASMLEPGMLADLDDHLERSFELLGPLCRVLILHDVMIVKGDEGHGAEGGSCVAALLGAGMLRRDRVRALIARHVPDETDIVIPPGPVEPQLEWLGRL